MKCGFTIKVFSKSSLNSFDLHQSCYCHPTPRNDLSVGSFVRRKVLHLTRTISRQRKELPKIRWCQNDQIFEGFLDFPKKYEILDFWIFGFLDFFGFLAISRQQKEIPEIRWCQNDRIF